MNADSWSRNRYFRFIVIAYTEVIVQENRGALFWGSDFLLCDDFSEFFVAVGAFVVRYS